MSTESEIFQFNDVEWKYVESTEIGSRHRKPPTKVGVQSVSVTCKGCGHSWRAHQYGDGRLHPTLGGVLVTCPSCNVNEHVKGSVFQESA